MREKKNKTESIPTRSEARRPRRSRSREAFKQRQKKLVESGAQECRVYENRIQEIGGVGEDRMGDGHP